MVLIARFYMDTHSSAEVGNGGARKECALKEEDNQDGAQGEHTEPL